MNQTVDTVMTNLQKNNMQAHYVATKEEVVPLVESLLNDGDTVAVGGSVTLAETGVIDLLKSGRFTYLDRYAPGLTADERRDVFIRSMDVDAYFCSSNAITMQGELYNVDGNSNRIAAMAFGPKKVIVVASVDKIVADLPAAVKRVKTIAAPMNARRLNCDTYCNKTGHCLHPDGVATDGCNSPARICCSHLICGYQQVADRIQVILVGESCGY